MTEHLTTQDLQAFAGGELSREAARAAVAHLLRGCGPCRSEAAGLWQLNQPLAAPPADAYDAAFDRLSAALGNGKAEVETLLQRAWALRHDDPEEMRRTARLAVITASGLPPEAKDLLSRAWAVYGNACRIAGDLPEAQQALDRAAEILGPGAGSPEERARLYELQASLEAARGNDDLALTALDAAFALHQERGDLHMAGRALITKGLYTGYAGRSREAFRITQRGLDMVDETREPELVLAAIHNQIWFLVESGRLREARSLLGAHRDELATDEAQRLDLLWLEGRIRAGLRDGKRALLDLEAAEQGFAAAGRRSQAANVKLDQASIHLRLGDSARALSLIRAAEEAFLQIEAPQSTRMALAFLRQRLAQREIPAPVVLRLADLIRRGQRAGGRPRIERSRQSGV
jgi:tetratricopeptide (TPR) repeat protein